MSTRTFVLCIAVLVIIDAFLNFPLFAGHIFGKDDRRPVLFPSPPYSMVGRIRIETGGKVLFCSGSLVGPDLALTNLHCVDQFLTNKNDTKIYFQAFYHKGRSLADSPVTEIFADYQLTKAAISYEGYNDWAILKLENPIGLRLGWFEVASTAKIEKTYSQWLSEFVGLSKPARYLVDLAGYNGDIDEAEVLTVQKDCEIKATSSKIGHDCDMNKGSSGAPIYYLSPDGKYTIVAVNEGARLSPEGNNIGLHLKEYSYPRSNLAIDTARFYPYLKTKLKESLKQANIVQQ